MVFWIKVQKYPKHYFSQPQKHTIYSYSVYIFLKGNVSVSIIMFVSYPTDQYMLLLYTSCISLASNGICTCRCSYTSPWWISRWFILSVLFVLCVLFEVLYYRLTNGCDIMYVQIYNKRTEISVLFLPFRSEEEDSFVVRKVSGCFWHVKMESIRYISYDLHCKADWKWM
jgi:hypothetical protein